MHKHIVIYSLKIKNTLIYSMTNLKIFLNVYLNQVSTIVAIFIKLIGEGI